MFRRALVAFLVCPGVVAYGIPAYLAWNAHPSPWSLTRHGLLGAAILTFGTSLLLWCVRDFYETGRGTLAPWAPPGTLVRIGLYRVSRNPMYLAVGVILLGWASSFPTAKLFTYGGVVMTAFHLRVVFGEEPWLARRHGEAWRQYRDQVPRWVSLGSRFSTLGTSHPPRTGGRVDPS